MSDDEHGVDLSKDTETAVIDTGEPENYSDAKYDALDGALDDHLDSFDETVDASVANDETQIIATDVHEDDAVVDSVEPERKPRSDIWRRKITVRPIPVILVVLLLASGGLAAWLYNKDYQPDEATRPSVSRAAINAASEGTVALLSYSPDSLDKDFANARSHLSGDFLSYYDQIAQDIMAPAAKQKALKTTAKVARAGIKELTPDSAVVLVFVDQTTTSKDNPEPAKAASSALVTLALIDGKWLITKFQPV